MLSCSRPRFEKFEVDCSLPIVSLLSTTTSRVILLLVRIKSKSITDPKRISRGFVNQGNWEVGRLGEGWVKRRDRKFSKYLFLFGKNQRFCLEVI